MQEPGPATTPPGENSARRSGWMWVIVTGCLLVTLLGILWPRSRTPSNFGPAGSAANSSGNPPTDSPRPALAGAHLLPRRPNAGPGPTAEEIVARKLAQFAQSRREFVHALAGRHNVTVSDAVERFFDAVESGDWSRIETTFKAINGGDSSAGYASGRPPGIEHLWPAIIDAYGVAEQVHLWPAQKLLDYGNAALSSLRPGMVYVGGTDNGR